jgi:hypothetical protein
MRTGSVDVDCWQLRPGAPRQRKQCHGGGRPEVAERCIAPASVARTMHTLYKLSRSGPQPQRPQAGVAGERPGR